ncbi:hypothetical protein JCM1841_004758 [Sporobolomyces salmonicolor]
MLIPCPGSALNPLTSFRCRPSFRVPSRARLSEDTTVKLVLKFLVELEDDKVVSVWDWHQAPRGAVKGANTAGARGGGGITNAGSSPDRPRQRPSGNSRSPDNATPRETSILASHLGKTLSNQMRSPASSPACAYARPLHIRVGFSSVRTAEPSAEATKPALLSAAYAQSRALAQLPRDVNTGDECLFSIADLLTSSSPDFLSTLSLCFPLVLHQLAPSSPSSAPTFTSFSLSQ